MAIHRETIESKREQLLAERARLAERKWDALKRTGIAEQAGRGAAAVSFSFQDTADLVFSGADIRRQENRDYLARSFEEYGPKYRKLVFGVQDIGARREIIALDIALSDLKLKEVRIELDDALRKLTQINKNNIYGSIIAAIFIGLLVQGTWQTFGPMWDTVVAVFCLALWIGALPNILARDAADRAAVQKDIEIWRETLNEVAKQRLFDSCEAKTGEAMDRSLLPSDRGTGQS